MWSKLSNIVHLRTVRSQMHRVSRCDSFDSKNKGPLWPSRELPSMIWGAMKQSNAVTSMLPWLFGSFWSNLTKCAQEHLGIYSRSFSRSSTSRSFPYTLNCMYQSWVRDFTIGSIFHWGFSLACLSCTSCACIIWSVCMEDWISFWARFYYLPFHSIYQVCLRIISWLYKI